MGRANGIIKRFPAFYRSRDFENNFYHFIEVFGAMLDAAENDLIKVMRAHWVDTADNEDSKGFDSFQKGDLDKIFSLYLENLGGTSQLRQVNRREGEDGLLDDVIYRERIKGLINVLKNGASTREGIIAIVAANLGIVGESPEAIAARQQIRIEEFMPREKLITQRSIAINEEFTINNINVIPSIPNITLEVRNLFNPPVNNADLLNFAVVNPRIVNTSSGASIQYLGRLLIGEQLTFFANGEVLLNGQAVSFTGNLPALPSGNSTWQVEAQLDLEAGLFDQSRFDVALFDVARLDAFDNFVFGGSPLAQQLLDFTMKSVTLRPASFTVIIPYDIPGFTDQFEGLSDHPRNKIQYIVNKVKAAGVFAAVAFEKRFIVDQGLDEHYDLEMQFVPESLDMQENDFDILSAQNQEVENDLEDRLILSGVFDITHFDSLNTFA